MKRLEGQYHMWTNKSGDATAYFIRYARELKKISDGAEFDAIDEDNKWTTYDIAVDVRAILSDVVQDLLK